MIPKSCGLFGSDHATEQVLRAAARLLTVPALPCWSCSRSGSVLANASLRGRTSELAVANADVTEPLPALPTGNRVRHRTSLFIRNFGCCFVCEIRRYMSSDIVRRCDRPTTAACRLARTLCVLKSAIGLPFNAIATTHRWVPAITLRGASTTLADFCC